MAQPPPPLTDEEKHELALQSEHELARLMRTYTIMARNREEYMVAQSGGKLAKHSKVLNVFKKEQTNILTDLAVASAKARVKEDEKRSRKLGYLLEEFDEFDDQIKTERNYTKEIEGQIQMMKKKALELTAKQISEDKYQERILKGEKTVQILENKLEVQVKKFCAIGAENVQLRAEIHHLLNERTEFNKTWDKLINNLCIGKKFMMDLIEQATIAYDQREEWVSKLEILKTKAHNELVANIQEMREMQRKRDNEVKLQEFFATKGQKRYMKNLEEDYLRKRQKNKELIKANLEKYSQMLTVVKEFTQRDDIPKIARDFLSQEEENFAKFKYVNDLNKQMEDMSDDLTICHQEIDKQKVLHQKRAEQQENTLKELELKVNMKKKAADAKEADLHVVEKKLATILNGIDTLFKLFKCHNDPIIRMLGHNETIHYYNAALYLQILEKTIHEALVTVHYKEASSTSSKKAGKPGSFVVRQDIVPGVLEPVERICRTSPCPLCVEHDLVSDVIDDLQRAYNKKEIEEKLKVRLKTEGSQCALHNVSACHLPKSRQIIQKRYQ